jgi:hypothetical protein
MEGAPEAVAAAAAEEAAAAAAAEAAVASAAVNPPAGTGTPAEATRKGVQEAPPKEGPIVNGKKKFSI